jgi:hypothetical protein
MSLSIMPANKSIKWVIENYKQSLEAGREVLAVIGQNTQNVEGTFVFRIEDNLLRPEYQDFTILIRDYKYMKTTTLAYVLKYSIYSRLYRRRENYSLNPSPPDIEVTVYEILPDGHSNFLSSEEMNDIEEKIILETSQFWKSEIR